MRSVDLDRPSTMTDVVLIWRISTVTLKWQKCSDMCQDDQRGPGKRHLNSHTHLNTHEHTHPYTFFHSLTPSFDFFSFVHSMSDLISHSVTLSLYLSPQLMASLMSESNIINCIVHHIIHNVFCWAMSSVIWQFRKRNFKRFNFVQY